MGSGDNFDKGRSKNYPRTCHIFSEKMHYLGLLCLSELYHFTSQLWALVKFEST